MSSTRRVYCVIWDAMVLFPPGAWWESDPPSRAVWAGGDIIDVVGELEKRL